MDNNIDFKDLWKKQSVSSPDMEELFSKVRQFKKASLKKLIVTNILLLATCVFIICIWVLYKPEFLTTKIGIMLIVTSVIIFLFVYNKLFSSFTSIDNLQSNSEFVHYLISIKTRQHFLNTTMLNLYYILLSVGISLYMIEPTMTMSLPGKILAYTITLAWIAFSWFYIRPKTIKKQQGNIDELIHRFEGMDARLRNWGE
jgi:hypothetical protein